MTRRLSAFLVDDERLARAELRRLLAAHSGIAVVGEAASLEEAAAALDALAPDVVFLDVEMPGGTGFDLIANIPSRCRIVFVTAYPDHALRAFDANAVDYLVKPVHPERLEATVRRLLAGAAPEEPRPPLRRDDPLLVPAGGHYQVVRVHQIAAIHAAKDHSEVVTADGTRRLVGKPLREWEETLPKAHFLRVHRSTIVNVDHVARVEPWFHSAFRIHLKGAGEPVVVSRRYAALLRNRLV